MLFRSSAFGASDNYVGRLADGRDVQAMIEATLRRVACAGTGFVLMDHVPGIEMGVGAYFDGSAFLEPACLDWEHKRFFPGDLGELTGEMGTVVTFDRATTFFERTLKRLAPLLREHGYRGYINLNTIVNREGIWPLEFTCRFGYPGFAICEPLQVTPWADLFRALTTAPGGGLRTRPGFSVGVVITTRPFPYARTEIAEPVGLPVTFEGPLSEEDRRNIHYAEVGLSHGELVTAGNYGWSMVVTGAGATIASAQQAAYDLARRVIIPNLRYRNDIGTRLAAGDYAEVERLGLLD